MLMLVLFVQILCGDVSQGIHAAVYVIRSLVSWVECSRYPLCACKYSASQDTIRNVKASTGLSSRHLSSMTTKKVSILVCSYIIIIKLISMVIWSTHDIGYRESMTTWHTLRINYSPKIKRGESWRDCGYTYLTIVRFVILIIN